MYAILIDREATKRYDPQKFEEENAKYQEILDSLSNQNINNEQSKELEKLLNSSHSVGLALVLILEEQFPDFRERKEFVCSVIEHKN